MCLLSPPAQRLISLNLKPVDLFIVSDWFLWAPFGQEGPESFGCLKKLLNTKQALKNEHQSNCNHDHGC
jgi:hypothetical protein